MEAKYFMRLLAVSIDKNRKMFPNSKKELFSGTSSNATDRTNLINDRKAVSKDVQTAWRKL